jgi:hypothetical protein
MTGVNSEHSEGYQEAAKVKHKQTASDTKFIYIGQAFHIRKQQKRSIN